MEPGKHFPVRVPKTGSDHCRGCPSQRDHLPFSVEERVVEDPAQLSLDLSECSSGHSVACVAHVRGFQGRSHGRVAVFEIEYAVAHVRGCQERSPGRVELFEIECTVALGVHLS
jgi:hypothetical protein